MAPSLSLTQLSYTAAGLLATPSNRLDGRALLAFRPLSITTGFSVQAAGSAEGILAGSTRCLAVVSADVITLDNDSNGGGKGGESEDGDDDLIECSIDVHPAIPSSANLNALVLTLQKTLNHTLRAPSTTPVPSSALVIVRSPRAPHKPTRAWRLNVDVTLADVSGGNVADVVMATVYAALNDVRLPKTRAIGFDAAAVQDSWSDGRKTDIFDVRGSLARTSGTVASSGGRDGEDGQRNTTTASTLSAQDAEKIGVDFEVLDNADATRKLDHADAFPIGVTVNVLANGQLLLDATPTEEACIPYTRRLLVLCSAKASRVVGTQMLTASLETGAYHLGEERDPSGKHVDSSAAGTGTCDYQTVKRAVRDGVQFAQALHTAIEAQLSGNSKQDRMQT